MSKGFQELIKDWSAEKLIEEFKNNIHLTDEQQGAIIMQLMEMKGITRHIEVAEILGVSRSYVSLRAKKAREKYPGDYEKPVRGRPRSSIIELDEFLGDKEIPLRLVVKKPGLTNSHIYQLLKRVINRWPPDKL